jgi:TPR repeat protein
MRLPVLAILLALPLAGQTTVNDQPAGQVSEQTTENLAELRAQAEQGNAVAQSKLGRWYAKGQGVPQDFAEAVKWLRKSAAQGNSHAQFNLGHCYAGGLGVPQNYVEAVKWFRKSADQGNDYAQCELGRCYYNGRGIPKDYSKAAKWFRKSAEQGNGLGQELLAICYGDGQGVKKDFYEYGKFMKKAAEQGEGAAQFFLSQWIGAEDYRKGMNGRYYHDPEVDPKFQGDAESYVWDSLAAINSYDKEVKKESIKVCEFLANKLPPYVLMRAQARAQQLQEEINVKRIEKTGD